MWPPHFGFKECLICSGRAIGRGESTWPYCRVIGKVKPWHGVDLQFRVLLGMGSHLRHVYRFRIKNRCRDAPRPRHPVRINPQSDRRIGVAELRRYVREIRSSGEHVRGPGMAQIVRSAPPDLREILNPVPDSP